MAEVTLQAGICGFTTKILAQKDDEEKVRLDIDTDCPHIAKAARDLEPIEPLAEIFVKPHETIVYKTFSEHLPHVTCPVYSALLKAVEVEAGLALPKDVSMKIVK